MSIKIKRLLSFPETESAPLPARVCATVSHNSLTTSMISSHYNRSYTVSNTSPDIEEVYTTNASPPPTANVFPHKRRSCGVPNPVSIHSFPWFCAGIQLALFYRFPLQIIIVMLCSLQLLCLAALLIVMGKCI